jgi:hypothetical protein
VIPQQIEWTDAKLGYGSLFDPQPTPMQENRVACTRRSRRKRCRSLPPQIRAAPPMFTSANLARIAKENGVDVSSDMTPNDIIAELRQRQQPGS